MDGQGPSGSTAGAEAKTRTSVTLKNCRYLNMIVKIRNGQIYRVDKDTGEKLAVKVLCVSHFADGSHRTPNKDFLKDMRVLSRIEHENLVKFKRTEYQKVVSRYIILMEFIDGHTLHDELQDLRQQGRQLDKGKMKSCCRMICSALNYLHSRQPHPIIHSNINAWNVMIEESTDAVKLIDFGVSRRFASFLSREMACWEKSDHEETFASPEIANARHRTFNTQSDIWAFGLTVYQMCSCQLPHAEKKTLFDKTTCIMENGAPLLPEVWSSDRELSDFYSSCVKYDPTKRSSAAQLLQHPFVIDSAATGSRQ